MRYYSTRDHSRTYSLKDAVMQGLAPDGGLFLPSEITPLPRAFFNNISQMTLGEIAYVISNTFFSKEIDSEIIKSIVADSLSFDIPIKQIGTSPISAIELFHGPTLAIKDIGARFMARLLRHYIDPASPINLLVATSGDTGSAVAAGFHDIPGVNVFILYPSGHVSPIQEAQFTTLGRNITAIEIYGTFDDCQNLVKQAFLDHDLTARIPLTSANSINIARLLPQTLYFFHGYAQMVKNGADPSNIVTSIPCGNLGTLAAAIISRRMGLPLKRIVAVNNTDGFFSRYMATGDLTPVKVNATLTTAIDIALPSNIERIIDLYGNDRNLMARDIKTAVVDDNSILDTIRDVDSKYQYLLDPHSAAAYRALADNLAPGESGLVIAAAHPAKFIDAVEKAIRRPLNLPASISEMLTRPRHRKRLPASYPLLREYLLNHF